MVKGVVVKGVVIKGVVPLALLAVLSGAAPTAVAAAPAGSRSAPTAPCAAPVLDRPEHGAAAVAALGDDLPAVAADNGSTARDLAADLRSDAALWLDRCGAAYYVEAAHPAAHPESTEPGQASEQAAASPFPSAETFALHSSPGSSRTVYLDFDGHTATGTGWNSGAQVVSPAYDTDGNAATFSGAERDVVQSVWQRVAEDFAPFDLDVTTEDPGTERITRSGTSDTVYGTRLVVADAAGPGPSSCGCGGVAYVDVFDDPDNHSYYQPAFVFTAGVGSGPKGIAEAASHEVGHNLGLDHDGTAATGYYGGQGVWAPIMGVSYGRPLSQWSRGEYAGANNAQDDLAVISANGAPRRRDDHGGTAATATPLGEVLTAPGLVQSAADQDTFSFVSTGTAGSTTVTVRPAAVSPDLDASVAVLAADGRVVASDAPTTTSAGGDVASGLGAQVTLPDLPRGSYTVRVDGVGQGDPAGTGHSDYGSVGSYDLSVTVPTPTTPAVTTQGLPPTVVGDAYPDTRLAVRGGTAPHTWSATGLPAGLALQAGGLLTGSASAPGSGPVTVTVTDALGATSSAQLPLDVAAAALTARGAAAEATTGRAYTARLGASGGTAPYGFALQSGTLPTGVALSSSGALSGTPTRAGSTSAVLRVTDTAGRTATTTVALVVRAPVAVSTAALPGATRGAPWSARVTATGGTGAHTWTRTAGTAGTLPAGTTLSAAGVLSGRPTTAARYAFSLTARDGAGRTATRAYAVVVAPPPAVPAQVLPTGRARVAYAATLTGTGGTRPYRWAVTAGRVPTGLTLVSTGALRGTPSARGTWRFAVLLTDARGARAARTLTTTIS